MKKTKTDPALPEKMSDAALSRALGRYQTVARIGLIAGLLSVLGSFLAAVLMQNSMRKVIWITVLFLGGICGVLFVSGNAQKKLKTLMQEQLGEFFRAEWAKAFGAELPTPELRIDAPFVKTMQVMDGQWEECTVENEHAGDFRGVPFEAANVRLDHVYERGTPHDGFETCRDMVFKGIVVRCKTAVPAPSPIRVTARLADSPRGIATDSESFDRRFRVAAEPEQDAFYLLTPQFMEWVENFAQHIEGKIAGFCWSGNVFSLALATDYSVAGVASAVDPRDIDAVCRSYCNSLRTMAELLELLQKNTPVFARDEREEREL